jgi:hypothetical protein
VPEEEDATQFATLNFRLLASHYTTPNFYRRGNNLDREYGMRRDADGIFRVGHSVKEIDNHSNIVIANKNFKGNKGLFELLTRNNTQRSEIT